MSPLEIIDKYYADNSDVRRLLLVHSWQVATRALVCAARHRELAIDSSLVLSGALLHDIGIKETSAPSIFCNGTEPYLMHGFIGARMLRQVGMEREARICERHTGAGLSKEAITKAGLDVPAADYLPETLEEKLICYVDKFYSKSRPAETFSFEQAYNGLLRFGKEGVERFVEWHRMFG
jgi:uncharacterized protein